MRPEHLGALASEQVWRNYITWPLEKTKPLGMRQALHKKAIDLAPKWRTKPLCVVATGRDRLTFVELAKMVAALVVVRKCARAAKNPHCCAVFASLRPVKDRERHIKARERRSQADTREQPSASKLNAGRSQAGRQVF